MIRQVVRFAPWMMVLATALGCGPGVSKDEATLRCDQEKANNATGCITADVYGQCISCQEECGDQCVRAEACPVQFTCPK